MRAMVLTKNSPIETCPLTLEERSIPIPQKGEVLIRIETCGICRTDLHIVEGDIPFQGKEMIPGHQIIGRVEKMGNSSGLFEKGDRVGVGWLYSTCGSCEFCFSKRENLCVKSEHTGYTRFGGFSEFCLAKEEFIYPLSKDIDPVSFAPLLCAGIIGFRALKLSHLPLGGETLGLFGFGSSAHLAIQIATQALNKKVFVSTRGKERRDLARDLGANWVGDNEQDFPEKVDSAIIFAPNGSLVPKALTNLKKGGRLILAGIYMSDIPSLDYQKHLFYEKTIQSVTSNTREDGKELLDIVSKFPLNVSVTPYSLEEANRALLDLKKGQLKGSGVLVIK